MTVLVPNRPVYWAVMYSGGGSVDVKIAPSKWKNPVNACKECWGAHRNSMKVKNLGPSIKVMRSSKTLAQLTDPASDGWQTI